MSAPFDQPDADSLAPGRPRIMAIDIIRGAVMVLMALDHVRVYAAVPAGGPAPGVFFTRWVTHFCAPAFVFLAGTGAFLHLRKLGSKAALSRYLLTRGALLVFLEMTVSRTSWTFNFDFYNYTEANVIWAIGWSMILLAALIHLPLKAVGAIGVAIIAGHNLMDVVGGPLRQAAENSSIYGFWQMLYFGWEFRWFGDGPRLIVLYSIVPWVGVMAAGYAFGAVMQLDDARRRKICLRLGLGAVALFLVLRTINLYGDPRPWGGQNSWPAPLAFLNPTKYPASLMFLLMTLGPTIALIPLLEQARGRLAGWLATFGRVPLFYYLLHIPLIHAVTVYIALVRTPDAVWWLYENHPLMIPPAPDGYRYSLPMLYGVWAFVVVLLYFPSHWYADLKARRRDSWLTYL